MSGGGPPNQGDWLAAGRSPSLQATQQTPTGGLCLGLCVGLSQEARARWTSATPSPTPAVCQNTCLVSSSGHRVVDSPPPHMHHRTLPVSG